MPDVLEGFSMSEIAQDLKNDRTIQATLAPGDGCEYHFVIAPLYVMHARDEMIGFLASLMSKHGDHAEASYVVVDYKDDEPRFLAAVNALGGGEMKWQSKVFDWWFRRLWDALR